MKPKHLWSLTKLCFGHPLFVWPTVKATQRCIAVSSQIYDALHNRNTPANAFRHALWNYWIAQRAFRWKKDSKRVTDWAKRITDWHEEFSPNEELAKQMDYHNNRIGREVFMEHPKMTEEKIVTYFNKMVEASVMISKIGDLRLHRDSFVHLIDFPKS